MNKTESALRRKLAQMRQANPGPTETQERPEWEQLLEKALQQGLAKVETKAATGDDGPAGLQSFVTKVMPGHNCTGTRKLRLASTQSGPSDLVIIRPDSLGDLILFEPVLSVLATSWSKTRIHVLASHGAKAVAGLMPERITWHFIEGANPWAAPTAVGLDTLRQTLGGVPAGAWLVSVCARKTWWDYAAPSLGQFSRCISLGAVAPLGADRDRLAQAGLGSALAAYSESIPNAGTKHEVRRNLDCVSYLLGCSAPDIFPALRITEEAAQKASEILSETGLAEGDFIACCAAGTANVAIKCWPATSYAECLAQLEQEKPRGVLLLGSLSEEPLVEELESLLRARGVNHKVWLGDKPEDFGVMCALLGKAGLYLGNDTGAMHAAAALKVPVVGIFGGGTWPRFLPCTNRGAAVVRPMPCFDCDWQCHFGDAPCVRKIRVETVLAATRHLLAGPDSGFLVFEEKWQAGEDISELGRGAAVHARGLRAQLLQLGQVAEEQRQYIEQLRRQLGEIEPALGLKKAEAEQRLLSIREQDNLISGQQERLSEQTHQLSNLEQHTRDRDASLQHANKVLLEQRDYIAVLEKQRDEKNELSRQNDATIAQLKDGICSLEGERDAGKKEISRLLATITEQQNYIQILEKARDENTRLQSEKATECRQLKEKERHLETTIAQQNDYIRSLEHERDAAKGDSAALGEEKAKFLATIHEQQAYIQSLEGERKDNARALKENTETIQGLQATVAKQAQQLINMEQVRDELTQTADSRLADLRKREATILEQLGYIQSLEKTRDELFQSLESRAEDARRHEVAAEEQRNNIHFLEITRDELSRLLEKRASEAADQEETLARLNERIHTLESELGQMAEKAQDRESSLVQLRKDASEASERLESRDVELKRVYQVIEDQTKYIKHLEAVSAELDRINGIAEHHRQQEQTLSGQLAESLSSGALTRKELQEQKELCEDLRREAAELRSALAGAQALARHLEQHYLASSRHT